ncbi:hypothetical protein [Rhodococcus erythropolis]|uniref:hypothetical protein n=1 Tax=Rhodococcus erythropolis TaxID=1833 RepID=UPI0039825B10
MSSVRVAAYLLGEAGLLDGRRCTTSWLYGADLASRYPDATVRADSLIGDRFVGKVLPDEAANAATPPIFEHVTANPHRVVTAHLVDETGSFTTVAREKILLFFRERLLAEKPARDQ